MYSAQHSHLQLNSDQQVIFWAHYAHTSLLPFPIGKIILEICEPHFWQMVRLGNTVTLFVFIFRITYFDTITPLPAPSHKHTHKSIQCSKCSFCRIQLL